MRIAIFGATSQIAKDLILSFSHDNAYDLVLYARRPDAVKQWLHEVGLEGRYAAYDFDQFSIDKQVDVLLNFVGVGNPAQAAAMGASIFDATLIYDNMALEYIQQHPSCKYIFLSSGAAYGSSFDEPANEHTKSIIPINNLQPQDWYSVAKLHAECRHRAFSHLPIVDVRVFNCFSHTQDMSARFLITDVLRAVRDGAVLRTSHQFIVRDFLHPSDFHLLVSSLILAPPVNVAVDCYSRSPVDKATLLSFMRDNFGLQFEYTDSFNLFNATGIKPHYYSLNKKAGDFGYAPKYSSLDGLKAEFDLYFRSRAC